MGVYIEPPQLEDTICDLKIFNNQMCVKTSTDYCDIDGTYGYKWPKLSELYAKLFDEEILETHDAEKDMEATQKCFWELKDKGVIKLLKS